jgi:hypothetical protein
MTIRWFRNKNSLSKTDQNANIGNSQSKRTKFRRYLLEALEPRQLMAVGPQLIGIQQNTSELLKSGDVLTQAPRELVFRFDDAQLIDASTVSGIRISRAGGDGSFDLASTTSDFGSTGRVNIQFTSTEPGRSFTINVTLANLGANAQPTVGLSGNTISLVLNNNATTTTTADQLVNAVNSSAVLNGAVRAKIHGGLGSTRIGSNAPASYSPIVLSSANDSVVVPGAVLVGQSPDQNEVTVRFAEALKDDNYRIEIFGFDDPGLGIVGLRNVPEGSTPGNLFRPSLDRTRKDTIDFRLDLGPQVVSVVPQPTYRVNGQLQQRRDTIVVYFDNDKLLVENDANGRPTARSVENPEFYQLIFTSNTVRNTDDLYFNPTTVAYNAAANTATLVFDRDINDLAGSSAGASTFRLRIGTRETAPLPPARQEASATAISDLNTNGAVKVRFTSLQVGEAGSGVQVVVTNSGSNGLEVTTGVRSVTVNFGGAVVTAQEFVDAIRNSIPASALISVDFEPGSIFSTIVSDKSLAYSPVTLLGLGSTFDTSLNLGTIGSALTAQTSLVLSSAIDPEQYLLDLQGASDDAAHRRLAQNLATGFEDHVNPNFGADKKDGITTIYYNFRATYATTNTGLPMANAINAEQRARAREVLALWSKYIGVQFVETADIGLTIAAGPVSGILPVAGTQFQNEGNFGVRIDTSFQNSLIVLSATNTWGTEYGASYSRTMAAAVGMALGLHHAGDLPETTLMRLDPVFLAGSGPLTDINDVQLTASDERYEPVYPGNQDILHGRFIHRPDGTDIDLYRFEVDLGTSGQVGLLTAETYAQRLGNSSPLNTNISLFRQKQAVASTSFGSTVPLSLSFEAVKSGAKGNQLQIFFTQSEKGANVKPSIIAFPNALSIDLNTTIGSESTVQDIMDAINNSPAASSLVRVRLTQGVGTTKVGSNVLTQNPVVLAGGEMELVSQNDDYFSQDSLIKMSLGTGVYFLGVSASGNADYNGAVANSGFGGQSQGNYELRLTFRAAVDTRDAIQDMVGTEANGVAVGFDGDADGKPGGTHDFWFQTRPIDRVINFNAGGSDSLEGRTITIVSGRGTTNVFEFDTGNGVQPGRFAIPFSPAATASNLASSLAAAINARTQLGVTANAFGSSIRLTGERSITLDPALRLIDIQGKTIFVDKSAGPNADGSLANPFNNISAAGVPNAFAAAQPGDIVRIVGNGGLDGNLATVGDNFAYEIGRGLLSGSVLSDGISMDVPRGVTTIIDAGAVFKLRDARIGIGSSNVNIDRSGGVLQVLGAPVLLDANGNAQRTASGSTAEGRVYFTSWLDETIGLDTYLPTTTPTPGNWGGISINRELDVAAGRRDLENQGIFLQHIGFADIRFGGGTLNVESVTQTVNPIELLGTRATITDNVITRSSSAAISALPSSFEETNFNEPRFQTSGSFTSDYDRVGPNIKRNTLLNNSVNGLFIRVDSGLNVPGRFDDTDIVHVLTDNLVINGNPGGALLDSTVPPSALISVGPNTGGLLQPGFYNYKITFVDRNGYESIPSDPSITINLLAGQTAISIASLPGATGDFVERRLYRSQGTGTGPYDLVANLDRNTSSFRDVGQFAGGTLIRDRADVSTVALTEVPGGTLPAGGRFTYRVVMVDAGGREGLASNPTSSVVVGANSSVRLDNLPRTLAGFVGRRVYRSANGGGSPFQLIADLQDGNTTFLDTGASLTGSLAPESLGVQRPRLNASLVIDPGMVIKSEAARIELTFGANLIAEGLDGLPIVFTSRQDDTVGAGGTFDTNNNRSVSSPAPGDWGGIYAGPTTNVSLDYARIAFGGGVTRLDSTFRAFNALEIHQADARIAHTLFENNANGFGGQGPGTRLGRLSNERATVFVRGAQPVIIDNIFRGNAGSAITIDLNSMTDDFLPDTGRQTGFAERNSSYLANRGPLIRDNRMFNNGLNGLNIRAGQFLTTASIWDDTDIVHVVTEEIFVGNVQHEGGLRLQSAPTESLVVKFDGYGSNFNRNLGAGLTANGQLTSARDRVGGTIHLVGQPGFPVILTSLADDTAGAGLQPDGKPQTDTNNDGIGSVPQAADWRGILLDQYSNDRNVAMVLETEDFAAAAPGPNGFVGTAQVLGTLAANTDSGDENRRLGFVVSGVLSQAEDVDVYSFTGVAGSEIWLDIDHTRNNLDLVIEFLNANGELLARSDNSTFEAADPSLIFTSDLIDRSNVNPLATRTVGTKLTAGNVVKEDGTVNPLDPGMRIRLPGSNGTPGSYFVRVRSASTNADASGAGLSSGSYELQVRLREAQEFAGSTVNYTDIRYATNGVRLRGLPGESPLIGEAGEDESVRDGQIYASNDVATGRGISPFLFNDVNLTIRQDRQIGNRPQYLGNILDTAKGGFSVAGNLSSFRDVDFYAFQVNQQDIVGNLLGGHASVVFDLDYAVGLNRPDTSINIFVEEPSSRFGIQYRLIYSSDSSNIADDQGRPLSISDVADLSRGSTGTADPFVGPIALPEGNYLVAISSAAYQPRAKLLSPANVKPISSIRRIVDENAIAGVTTADLPVVQNFLPANRTIGVSGVLTSAKTFDLGAYAAADLPNLYLDYSSLGGTFEVFIRESSGAEFAVASSTDASLLRLVPGANNSVKIPLSSINARPAGGGLVTRSFAGQDGLSLVFRGPNGTRIDNVIIGFAERGESVGVANEPILLGQGNIFAPAGLQGNPLFPPFLRGAPGSFVQTRPFTLTTYDPFFDGPQVAFDYEVFNGQMDVFVVDADDPFFQVRIATTVNQNLPFGFPLLVTGRPASAVIDISQYGTNFATGQDRRLQVEFRARNDDPSRTVIRNVHIQLLNGARVGSGEPNPTFAVVPVPSTTVTTGAYQLEVRLGDQFFNSNSTGGPTLTKSIDTNDRLAEQITLVAPAGSVLTDGDRFTLSDGGRLITFEFSTDANVGLGNVPVRFTPTDANFVVARAIRDAVNSSGVQAQFQGNIRAASSNGVVSGTSGRDAKVDLHGSAYFNSVQSINPAGRVSVIFHQGVSDRNIRREQSQVIIQNSYIRESRDYGIFSEAPARLQDPRDVIDPLDFFDDRNSVSLQNIPKVAGTQAVRNLLQPNNSVQGGLVPGIVVQNNVLEEGGLGGVIIQGETPIWMISPGRVPYTFNADPNAALADYNPFVNTPAPTHFGGFIDDGDVLVIDADRTRVRLEFEDLAGGGTGNPIAGSGQVEGNGVSPDSSVGWYRDTGGSFYQRLTCTNCTAFATNAYETMHALRDSINSSLLISNGTTQTITATVAESLLGPDPFAPDSRFSIGYPEYFNRPALYLEGVSTLQWQDFPLDNTVLGFLNPFDIRQLDLGEIPQPQARIVNNTIIGRDGRASFHSDSATVESNDTIATATQTLQGTAHNPLFYSDVGMIGNGLSNSASSSAGTGGGSGGTTSSGTSFRADQFLVQFIEGVSAARQAEILAAEGLQVIKRFDFINTVLVGVTPTQNTVVKIESLNQLAEVEKAERDPIYTASRVPNDIQYPQQWHYNNVGQTGGVVDADIDLPEAWDTFVGSSQTVIAVLDSGVDYNHPDLRANMWVNPGEIVGDGIDNDGNGYVDDIYGIDTANRDSDPMDDTGHGTHVAGTTAAAGNNSIGVSGVSWNSKIMALKVLGLAGGSTGGIIEAIDYMVTMKTRYGINIVVSNNSYGGGGFSQAFLNAIQASIDAGIPFVASAGNSGTDNDLRPHYPDGYDLDGIISVAASDHNDRLAGFSQYGRTTVDLAAPGVDILSTTLGGGYGINSGTSMASPHVAGVVALLAGYAPKATVSQLKSAILLGADPIAAMDGTTVTGARLNAAKSLFLIGSGDPRITNRDVDLYQFKLGVGERAIIDIDSAGSGLDSYLQIFDSRGVAQTFTNAFGERRTFSDNDVARGEAASLDSYADFTATAPGVYFAAVSSVGNTSYDPLSSANRRAGSTTGAYRITVSARHMQDFVIVAEDANQYQQGQTFTIFGVPDIDGTGSSGRTFEFTFGAPVARGNVPINLAAGWRFPDVAQAITRAVNEGINRGPSISNFQQLPNGIFGLSSPLPPVHAQALGGIGAVIDAPFRGLEGDKLALIEALSAVDEFGTNQLSDLEIRQLISGPFSEVNQGLQLFPRRLDGFIIYTTTNLGPNEYLNITSLSHLGIGHDRQSTNPVSDTSLGDGTSEKFVVIKNAAWINGNGSIIVDPDVDDNNNLDQLLPETGVLATRGASPSILNNVFYNVQTPIINEESRTNPSTFRKAPYGTLSNPNVVSKPGQVVIGGSVYQHYETAISSVRFGTGIETSPTNVPNTSLDQNLDVPSSTRLFVNAQAGQYFPAPASPIIDSSVNRLSERTALASVKTAMGLPVSDLFAPDFDLVGQLRADDPNYAPPGGIGQNVFKDRGALDRADFIGPTAILLDPIDNDSLGVDRDDSVSVVRLTGGVYPEFRIQLKDGNEPTNPLRGIGVDDNSVINSTIQNLRVTGAAVVLTENGRLLVEGFDYRFEYNANRDEIVLTPLAGVWKNGNVYDITINNKDRFVIDAASGDQISDGDQFTVTDNNGGVVYFEFDSGFRLQLPQGLTIQVPIAGALAGGIADGDRFTINDGTRRVTFELDNNSSFLDGNRQIRFRSTDTQVVIAQAIVDAITAAGLAVSPRLLPSGDVYVGAAAGVKITTTFSRLEQPQSTLGLFIPAFGAVIDGQTFSLSDGLVSLLFEFDSDNLIGTGRTRVDISGASSVSDLARIIQSTIANTNLQLTPRIIGNDTVHLGLPAAGTVDRGTTNLEIVGVSRSVADGQSFSITFGTTTKTFEFDSNNSVANGNIRIELLLSDTQDSLGARTAAVIAANGLGLNPIHVRDGNIAVGGTSAHSISVLNAPSLSLFGQPNVTPNTTVEMLGTVVLQVPTLGGTSMVDNSTFAIRANNQLVVFEFDGNVSGPSAVGNVVIPFTAASTASEIVDRMVIAINSAGLNIVSRGIGNGRVDLGAIATSQVELRNSGLTMLRGNVTDGEFFTISNGTTTTTFEFVNVSLGGGAATGRLPILFSNSSTRSELFAAMKTAIESSTLGLSTTVIATTTLRFADTPRYTYDFSGAPSLLRTGVPGGAIAVPFIQDQTFTGKQVAQSIVRAINGAPNTPLEAKIRGDNTLFVENATSISEDIANYFIRAVEDLAGNDLRPNRINNETQFTILMPGVELDYGDAPDPVTTTPGRYPTLDVFDGARHVASAGPLRLGTTVTNDLDGKPSPSADADVGDDGVTFRFQNLNSPLFNRNVDTQVTVTLSAPGFVDAWIDFNSDGDWEDPGEQVISNTEFTTNLTRTFQIRVPSTSPVPPAGINSFARFRTSSAGNHLPTGLALDGEVEDYLVRILPGIPPTGVTNVYTMDEDQQLVTTDPDGQSTPGFVIDDGVLANDINPESRVLSAILVSPPQNHNGTFTLNLNGTFTYVPKPDFFGIDTFVYRGFVTINAGQNEIIESLADTTVTIDVRPVNDPPIASNVPVPTEDLFTNEDQALRLTEAEIFDLSNALAGPANEQNQTLRVSLPLSVTSQSGSVSITNGVLTYTPRADFSGIDTFVFTVTDNGVTGVLPDPRSVTRTMTVRVLDVNDPPITTPKQGRVDEDQSFTRPISFFLNGDSPVEPGQSLVFVFDANSTTSTTSTQGGTVTFDGTNVRYTPALNFNGTDTFFYLVTDNGPNPTNSVGTVTMTVDPINDPPQNVIDFPRLTLAEDAPEQSIDLRLYFRDPDVVPNNDLLTYRVRSNSNASLADISFAGNTMFVRPRADQHGSAVVEVEARDIAGATVVNVLNITITPVEDSPRLASPLPDISENEDSTIDPITLSPTHFFDPDVVTNSDQLTYVVEVTNPNLLTAAVVNGQLRLTLAANASGSARVTVRATDKAGNSISDSFDVLVNAVNDGPIGAADVYDVPLGSTFTTTDATGALTASKNDDGVLANDIDAEGNSFTARLTRNPTRGSVTLNSDGTFTYRTNAQAVVGGTDTFEYEGVDSFGAVGNRTTVTIRIGNPLPSPHRNPSQLRDSNGQLIGNMDVDADGNVSAIDVLIVVNFINANGSVPISGLSAPPPYRDVNGNLFIDALDVLEVVNYLNSRSNFSGSPEGEGEGQVVMVGLDSTSSPPMAWSRSVSRDNSNVEVELSNVVVGPVQPRQANNSIGMSLADYLAGFAEDEEGDDIATALVSNVDPGNELLDSFFADSFLE